MSKAPIIYMPNYINTVFGSGEDARLADYFWANLPWLDATEARRECWMNDQNAPYTYGSGRGERTYQPQPWDPEIVKIRDFIGKGVRMLATSGSPTLRGGFEGCFTNGYANEKNALGWHSDDDPKIDHKDPIAVVSFGAARSIMLRPNLSSPEEIEQITLGSGSLLLMMPGMQQAWLHKIPRHSAPCGKRISLTFRSLTQ